MTRGLLLGSVAILLVAFILLPLGLLAIGAGQWTLALGEGEAIWNTVLLAAGTAALALLVGLYCTDIAIRRLSGLS